MVLQEYRKQLNDFYYSETKKYQKKYGFKMGKIRKILITMRQMLLNIHMAMYKLNQN